MKRTAVINVVGLTPACLGASMPKLTAWANRGYQASIAPILPAVTCSIQATYLTGKYPSDHGIVANGWYFRDECEVKFWRQSNRLIQAPKVWELAKALDPTFTCANLFWWYNMYSTVDYAVTPRPLYPIDGRKIPDLYTYPVALRSKLQEELGQFPLFQFWGPATTIASSQWIAESAKWIESNFSPTLSLVYLPHLDYCAQKLGSNPAQDLQQIDNVVGSLIDFYEQRGVQLIILSEYGITPVNQPVHINRILRSAGLLQVREELGLELLDAGASQAFAVADHQIAHVYINNLAVLSQVKELLEKTPGIEAVLDQPGKKQYHLDHQRSGELVAIAKPEAWFTYYYWLDDAQAPDFARTVDIHRKPGYDPVELFIDPKIKFPKLKIAKTLLKRQLGLYSAMDLTPLNANLVRGSHGHLSNSSHDRPIVITQQNCLPSNSISALDICGLVLSHLTSSLPIK
jgi:predicted AlkP superfamily pyrophosphatase or phosphodiesterase